MEKSLNEVKNNKTWNRIVIIGTSIVLIAAALFIIVIDPFFHYHKPLSNMKYNIYDERYQNDGISRHFEYSAIITGTSMTENFKTSDFEKIFGEKAIKVPFSGASYREVNDNLNRAFKSSNTITTVVRCLDYSTLIQDKNYYRTDMVYPKYLTNDHIYDDVSYLMNKEILMKTLDQVYNNYKGLIQHTTTFDDYANWNKTAIFGKQAVLSTYEALKDKKTKVVFSKKDKKIVKENMKQNVVAIAREHPQTIFYVYFSPYSVCYWENIVNSGKLEYQIESERIAIEELLQYENIKLFSFTDDFELTCNLDNYKDVAHYGEWVNTWILEWMKNDDHHLTKSNYSTYLNKIYDFYSKFDYAQLHQ